MKKIRFESTTGEQIAMFEFIARYSGANVALQGTASQSSDRNNGEPLHASRAIDGDNITYSHTNDSNATWEIDFDQTYQIDSVMILNRYCGDDFAYDPLECLCRLSNSTLMLMSENNEVLSAKSLGDTCNQSIIYVQFGKDYPCHTSPNSVYAHHEKSTDNFTLYSHNQTDDLEFDTGVDIYFSIALVYSGSRWFGTLEFGLEKDFKLDQLSYGYEYHAFWDRLYEGRTFFLSDPYTGAIPVGVDFYENQFLETPEWNDYGPWGLLKPIHNISGKGYFHCMGTNNTAVKISSGTGAYGV